MTSATYSLTASTTGTALNIAFTSGGTYTLTAGFRLPNGSTHTYSKTVTVKPVPATPAVIRDPRSVEAPGCYIVFSVLDPQSGVSYEWDVVQGNTMWASTDFIYVYCPYEAFPVPSYPWYLIVKCRAYVDGCYSPWNSGNYEFMDYSIGYNQNRLRDSIHDSLTVDRDRIPSVIRKETIRPVELKAPAGDAF